MSSGAFLFGLEQVAVCAVDPVAADMPISEYLSRFYSGRIVSVGECATYAVLVRAEQSPTGREDHCSAYTINNVIRHASMNASPHSMMCCVSTAIVIAAGAECCCRIARERGTGTPTQERGDLHTTVNRGYIQPFWHPTCIPACPTAAILLRWQSSQPRNNLALMNA